MYLMKVYVFLFGVLLQDSEKLIARLVWDFVMTNAAKGSPAFEFHKRRRRWAHGVEIAKVDLP